jgi:hypothetical protein
LAVHTISGTSERSASITAAWKWAAAVPLVHSATAGVAVARPWPSAANPADRSSWNRWTSIRRSAARASASGVDREPGATKASVTPSRDHSSTSVAQKVAVAVTGCSGVDIGQANHTPGRPAGILTG